MTLFKTLAQMPCLRRCFLFRQYKIQYTTGKNIFIILPCKPYSVQRNIPLQGESPGSTTAPKLKGLFTWREEDSNTKKILECSRRQIILIKLAPYVFSSVFSLHAKSCTCPQRYSARILLPPCKQPLTEDGLLPVVLEVEIKNLFKTIDFFSSDINGQKLTVSRGEGQRILLKKPYKMLQPYEDHSVKDAKGGFQSKEFLLPQRSPICSLYQRFIIKNVTVIFELSDTTTTVALESSFEVLDFRSD